MQRALTFHCSVYSKDKLLATMMDIYACAGSHDRAEAIFDSMPPTTSSYNVLLKSLGNQGKPARATAILKDMLQSSHVKPDLISFNTVIDCWANDSSERDAYSETFKIFRLMEEDPKCKELGIHPDTFTFCSMLKCLSYSTREDTGKRVAHLLDEMESRHDAGDPNVKPTEIAYKLAHKACVRCGDLDRANILMWKMEQSETPPNVKIYNSFIYQLGRKGDWVAAERAEEILERMKEFSVKDKISSLMPNSETYCLVMDAWARSGHDSTGQHLWMLYEQMKREKVQIDMTCYTRLIEALSKANTTKALKRAEYLLQTMGKRRADYRHYNSIIKGWLNAGGADRAEKVLMRSVEAYVNDKNVRAKVSPAIVDMVIQGWIKQDDLPQATLLLDKMQELYDTEKMPDGPDLRAYDTLLGGWRRSLHPEKSKNMEKLEKKIAELRALGCV